MGEKINAYRVPYRISDGRIDFYKEFKKSISNLNDPTHRGGFCVYTEVSAEDVKRVAKDYSRNLMEICVCNNNRSKKYCYLHKDKVQQVQEDGRPVYIYWYFLNNIDLLGSRIFKYCFEDKYETSVVAETISEKFNRVETPIELDDEPIHINFKVYNERMTLEGITFAAVTDIILKENFDDIKGFEHIEGIERINDLITNWYEEFPLWLSSEVDIDTIKKIKDSDYLGDVENEVYEVMKLIENNSSRPFKELSNFDKKMIIFRRRNNCFYVEDEFLINGHKTFISRTYSDGACWKFITEKTGTIVHVI